MLKFKPPYHPTTLDVDKWATIMDNYIKYLKDTSKHTPYHGRDNFTLSGLVKALQIPSHKVKTRVGKVVESMGTFEVVTTPYVCTRYVRKTK